MTLADQSGRETARVPSDDRVLAVEMRLLRVRDEELRVSWLAGLTADLRLVRIRPCVRHSHDAAGVELVNNQRPHLRAR